MITLFSTSAFAQNSQNAGCQLDTPCELDSGRSYHVKVPADWDGKARLTVLMHFYGWLRTGALPVQHDRISGATRRRGLLLVASNDNRKIWDFWDSEADDFPFGAAALEGVSKNYLIDKD